MLLLKIFQEVQASCHIQTHQAVQLEVQQLCLKVEEEWALAEDLLEDAGYAATNELVRILDWLEHVSIKFGVVQILPQSLELVHSKAEFIHVVHVELFSRDEADALFAE